MEQVDALLDAGRADSQSKNLSRAGSESSLRESRRARSERSRSPDSRDSGSRREVHEDRREREKANRDRHHDRKRSPEHLESKDHRRRRSRSRSPYYRRRGDDSGDRSYDRHTRWEDREFSRRNHRSASPVPRDRERRRQRSRSPMRNSPRGEPHAEGPADASREESPQVPEDEREMRSVFVSQISNRVDDRILANFFENIVQVGKVREAKVIVDRISKRSKGVAYVEFREAGNVAKAIAISGTKLLGIPIKVEYTESEKNRMAMASNTPSALQIPIGPGSDAHPNSSIPYNRLYIGSLNFNLSEQDLRAVFEPFGPVDHCDLHKDPGTGKSKGYGFVQFKKLADARVAFEKMNNFTLAGRQLQIRVGLSNEKGSAANSFRNEQSLEEGGGTQLNNVSRLELMQKLARNQIDMMPTIAPMTRVNVPTAVTNIILLKNMFSVEEASEKNFAVELGDDVRTECETKYGAIDDIYVDKDSQGEVYVKFRELVAAQKALEGLDGRFFGGAKISASFVSDAMFRAAAGPRKS